LNEQYQDNLIRNLQKAFNSSTIPSDILQVLLNLAEFMEHDAVALPINLNVLAELAQKGHAYAKALHYRELEFQTNPVRITSLIQKLSTLNMLYFLSGNLLREFDQY
jgi:FKBP12-rapamycin complex-associated protein